MLRGAHNELAAAWLSCLLAIAPFGCDLSTGNPDSAVAKRPDVVFITIDTLRPDHLSFYGYDEETAPFLASLAERSVVFTNAVSSSSWTAPSTASIFSGLYPNNHGVVAGLQAHRRQQARLQAPLRVEMNRIPGSVETMPEILGEHGYRTFGLGANLNIGPEIGFDRGFDFFERVAPARGFAYATAREMHGALERWAAQVGAASPHLVYLHFNDPHFGVDQVAPPPAKSGKPRELQLYDARIRYLDGWLDETFELLGVDDETLVVVVSDHGEAFGEHGNDAHACCSLHGEVNRVLMVWRAPGLGIRPRRIDLNVSLVDVLPTVLDVIGVEKPDQLDGRSLVEFLRGGGNPAEPTWKLRPILAHRTNAKVESWAIIRDRYKLIEYNERKRALFDIVEDPLELEDLSSEQPTQVAELAAELAALRSRGPAESTKAEIELSAEQQQRLRALGYLRD